MVVAWSARSGGLCVEPRRSVCGQLPSRHRCPHAVSRRTRPSISPLMAAPSASASPLQLGPVPGLRLIWTSASPRPLQPHPPEPVSPLRLNERPYPTRPCPARPCWLRRVWLGSARSRVCRAWPLLGLLSSGRVFAAPVLPGLALPGPAPRLVLSGSALLASLGLAWLCSAACLSGLAPPGRVSAGSVLLDLAPPSPAGPGPALPGSVLLPCPAGSGLAGPCLPRPCLALPCLARPDPPGRTSARLRPTRSRPTPAHPRPARPTPDLWPHLPGARPPSPGATPATHLHPPPPLSSIP
jgi:hypothetical protein